MDVNYINPFIESTDHVFKTALGCDIVRESVSLKDHFSPTFDVSAVIGLSGPICGAVVLSVSRTLAFRAVEAMLDMKVEEINGDVVDAIGEVTNMVAGGAKAALAIHGMSLGLPSVITGHGHSIKFPSNVRPICLMFGTPWGRMSVEVGLSPSGDAPSANESRMAMAN